MLERFGAQAAFGRQPTPREMRNMTIADRIASAYWDRKKSTDWPEWAKTHKSDNDLLTWVTGIVNG